MLTVEFRPGIGKIVKLTQGIGKTISVDVVDGGTGRASPESRAFSIGDGYVFIPSHSRYEIRVEEAE